MIDNEKIAEMMGGKPAAKSKNKVEESNWESQLISGFKQKVATDGVAPNTQKPADINNPKISGQDLENVGDKLKGVPPFLILGIICLVIPSFFPSWGFLRMFGMVFIVVAIFGKVIPKENKERAKVRIKLLWGKYKLKQMEKKLAKQK